MSEPHPQGLGALLGGGEIFVPGWDVNQGSSMGLAAPPVAGL